MRLSNAETIFVVGLVALRIATNPGRDPRGVVLPRLPAGTTGRIDGATLVHPGNPPGLGMASQQCIVRSGTSRAGSASHKIGGFLSLAALWVDASTNGQYSGARTLSRHL